MENLTAERWLEALIQTSPLRHLLRDEATMWVAWDEKTVNVAGVGIGRVQWSRPAMDSPKKLKMQLTNAFVKV